MGETCVSVTPVTVGTFSNAVLENEPLKAADVVLTLVQYAVDVVVPADTN